MSRDLDTEFQEILDPPSKPKFNARQLALELDGETPIARGGGELFTYRDGHYRPGGGDNLRERITRKLGDEWKGHRANETLGYLYDSAPRLLDSPPVDQINLLNGVLDTSDSQLAPHSSDFLTPIQIPVTFDPAAKCPAIDRFLADTLDPELAQVVYEVAGYLVTPDNTLQTAVLFLGEGANGKSTLLNVLTALIGERNVSSIALHRLDEDRFAPAGLYGKLANVFADLDARALQASSMFKSITGGDLIDGERKFKEPFSFRPYSRLLYSANEPPPTPDSSDAFFRRWLVLPFDRKFEGSTVDRNLTAKLTTPSELSGLLNRGLEHLPDLRKRGAFTATDASVNAAERFRVDADSVAGFLADRCDLDLDFKTPMPKMFPAYREWCDENNRRPVSKQKFNRRVEALHPSLMTVTVQGTQCWSGIGLHGGTR